MGYALSLPSTTSSLNIFTATFVFSFLPITHVEINIMFIVVEILLPFSCWDLVITSRNVLHCCEATFVSDNDVIFITALVFTGENIPCCCPSYRA